MKITRDNYEIYFIDYFDKELNLDEVSELKSFLYANPDLQAEFDAFDNSPIHGNSIKFKGKESLKKPIVLTDIDYEQELLIAAVENDITASQKIELNALVSKNQMLQTDYSIYLKTILKPDLNEKFIKKSKLKKFIITRSSLLVAGSSIAAGLIVFYSVFSTINYQPSSNLYSRTMANKATLLNRSFIEMEITPTEVKSQNTVTYVSEQIALNETISVEKEAMINTQYVERMRGVNAYYLEGNKSLSTKEVSTTSIASTITLNKVENITENKESKTLLTEVKSIVFNKEANEKVSSLDFAQAVISGYNQISGKSIKLDKYTDDKGQQYLAYRGENLNLKSKIKSR